jgi:hypothetical protein
VINYHQWQQEVLLWSMPVLPEAQPDNTLHAGMVALLQNSLVLEHTADNANTHMQDINICAVNRI